MSCLLERLPNELLSMIISQLSPSDTNTLCKTSTRFRTFLYAQCYERIANVKEVRIDFEREVLAIHHVDMTYSIFFSNKQQNPRKSEENSMISTILRFTISTVHCLGDQWNSHLEYYLTQLDQKIEQKELGALWIYLPNGETPLSLLRLRAKFEQLTIRRSDNSTPFQQQKIGPLTIQIRRASHAVDIDYLLSYAQILHLSVPLIDCSIHLEDALVLTEKFFCEDLPAVCSWIFQFQGDIYELCGYVQREPNGFRTPFKDDHYSKWRYISFGSPSYRFFMNIFVSENMLEIGATDFYR